MIKIEKNSNIKYKEKGDLVEVIIGNKSYHYNKEKITIEKIFDDINTTLSKNRYILGHLIVDDLGLLQNEEQYIIDNFDTIKKIQVLYLTETQFVYDAWEMTIKFLEEIMPQLEDLAIDFYQNTKKDLWERIIEFIDVLDQLFQSFSQISNFKELPDIARGSEHWSEYTKKLNKVRELVASLQEPMERRDTILLGDKLKWEIQPVLLDMKNNLQVLMQKEVK